MLDVLFIIGGHALFESAFSSWWPDIISTYGLRKISNLVTRDKGIPLNSLYHYDT